MKKIVSVLIATSLALAFCGQCFAAEDENVATSSGGSASSVVELTVEATPTSHTVPYDYIIPYDDSGDDDYNYKGTTTNENNKNDLLQQFSDVDPDSWYAEAVSYCLDNGLMVGYPDGSFGPDDLMTRAMLVRILWNMEGQPKATYKLEYADVPDGEWYTEAIRWGTELGIVNGYGGAEAGNFGPDDNITREQIVTIVWRYAEYKHVGGDSVNISAYADADSVADFALGAMEWACGSRVIYGTSETTLSPKEEATRAQIAAIIMRYDVQYGGGQV